MTTRPCSPEFAELPNHFNDGIVQLNQALGDRLNFPPTKIRERYLRNKLSIGLKFDCDFSGRNLGMCALVTFNDGSHGRREHPASGAVGQDEFSVLIDNIHVVEDRKGVINKVGGVVRLKPLYQVAPAGICDSLYFSFISGNLLFLDRLVVENGKLDFDEMLEPRFRCGELPDQMIQTRPQMVDDLTRENAKSERNRELLMVLNSLKEQLTVVLGQDGVFAFLEKPGDFDIQITDVLVGPY